MKNTLKIDPKYDENRYRSNLSDDDKIQIAKEKERLSLEAVKVFDEITTDLSDFSPIILGESDSYKLDRDSYYSGKKRILNLNKIAEEFKGTSLLNEFDIGNMILRFSSPRKPDHNARYLYDRGVYDFVNTDFNREDYNKFSALFEEANKRPLFLDDKGESYVMDQGIPREDLHLLYVSMPFFGRNRSDLSLEGRIIRKLFSRKLTEHLLSNPMLHYGKMDDGLVLEDLKTFGYFEGLIIIGHEKEFSPKKLVEIVRNSGKSAIDVYSNSKSELEKYHQSIQEIKKLNNKMETLQKKIYNYENKTREAMQTLYSKLEDN